MGGAGMRTARVAPQVGAVAVEISHLAMQARREPRVVGGARRGLAERGDAHEIEAQAIGLGLHPLGERADVAGVGRHGNVVYVDGRHGLGTRRRIAAGAGPCQRALTAGGRPSARRR